MNLPLVQEEGFFIFMYNSAIARWKKDLENE